MAKKINLNKNVFTKEDFNKTLNTSFKELLPPQTEEQIPLPTVEEFFNLYESLFFEIPKFGDNNSHDYIVNKSGDYINFEKTNEELQALLDEISQIRSENLTLSQENFNLKIELERLKALNTIETNPLRSNSVQNTSNDPLVSNFNING